MDAHVSAVNYIASKVRNFYQLGQSFRVFHGSSNSTRPRHGSNQNILDIGGLSNVLSVNTETRTALVEPNVPMDRLVEATLPHGLIPPVVMEFPGITAGGGFAGTSGESSSFRHGFFNDTINYVEMILGNGDVVRASRDERPDLFQGAAGAAGTLGITTLMEIRLIEAKDYVRVKYCRARDTADAIDRMQSETKNSGIDYLDGIVYSKDHAVIITGELTNVKPAEFKSQTFSDASDPWYYMHVEEKTRDLTPSSFEVEYVPLGEYLFRFDRGGYWVGRQGYTYFRFIPFNGFFRWLLDDYSHTRTLYHALHGTGITSQFVVQDLALPYETAEDFINYVYKELGIWPLWLCPLKGCSMPTFHPVTQTTEKTASPPGALSKPMLNIGLWGWGPRQPEAFVAKNRELEDKLQELGGRKWLYAHCYYTSEEFWNIYDGSWYQQLREKYNATTLPTIFQKVSIDIWARNKERKKWSTYLSTSWPIGGIWGMVLATLSGDIGLHRGAKWKYQGEKKAEN